MYLAGFSINVLSMLAVVLAVGLVVDDAIVMTENIYIRIERGMSPKEAGIEGAKEIFFAVISTTITLVAVFFPIVFMEGMTGAGLLRPRPRQQLHRQRLAAGRPLLFSAGRDQPEPLKPPQLFSGGRRGRQREPLPVGPAWHAGGVPAPQGARLPDRAGDGRHHLRPVEPDSVRDGAAGRPFDDYDQYARTGRRHLRIHTRLYRGHQPAGRHAGSRIPGRHGPRIERQRKRADRAERHHRTPTVADGYRRTAIQSGQKQDDGPRVRAATIDFRRPTRIDADSVRATSHQPRKIAGGTAGVHGQGLRQPDFPDGRRQPEIQQTRSPHFDQPRQIQPDGRQHPRHRADAAIRAQRPAHGVFLHERETIRNTRRDQPAAISAATKAR